MPLPDAIPSVRGRGRQPRRGPDARFADRGYDHHIYRDQVRTRGPLSTDRVPTAQRRKEGGMGSAGPDVDRPQLVPAA